MSELNPETMAFLEKFQAADTRDKTLPAPVRAALVQANAVVAALFTDDFGENHIVLLSEQQVKMADLVNMSAQKYAYYVIFNTNPAERAGYVVPGSS